VSERDARCDALLVESYFEACVEGGGKSLLC
jgi:hypothetical protein